MRAKFFLFVIIFLFFSQTSLNAQEQNTQESDQQISDFSLAGYADKGEKSWDISGKSADIFGDLIKLQDVVGNMYGKDEDIKLTADKGDFDKAQGKVHLEQNVVIRTSSGSKLTTESLDWDRNNERVTTQDLVNITRGNMVTVARGAMGEPDLNKVTLHKDIRMDINPAEEAEKKLEDKIIITCDGPLEIDYAKNIATFKNNVLVDTKDNLIYSDIMDIYFISSKENKETKQEQDSSSALMGTQIEKIVCKDNVKIVRGKNTSYSQEAIYTAFDKKIVLTGRPKLIIYSTEDLSASFGN